MTRITAIVLALLLPATPAGAGGAPCPADTNGDLVVDIDDVINVILDFGCDLGPGCPNGGEVNHVSPVDIDDVVAVVLAFGRCPQDPVNDFCDDALPLVFTDGVATAAGTLESATPDAEAVPCGQNQFEGQAGSWFSMEGTGDRITAGLCGSAALDFTGVQVYCRATDCAALQCVSGDFNDCPGQTLGEVSWCSEPGLTYLVRVVGEAGPPFELTVAREEPCADPAICYDDASAHDDCLDARVIAEGVTSFTSFGLTNDGPTHAGCNSPYLDAWFLHTATATGYLLVTTCEELGGSTQTSTAIDVYDGSGWPGLCGDETALDAALLACSDDDPDNPCGSETSASTTVVPVVLGEDYLIRVTGAGELFVGMIEAADDLCSYAVPIAPGGTTTPDTCVGLPDTAAPLCGAASVPDRPGRWLETIGDGTMYTVSVCPDPAGSFDARLAVYCYDCGWLVCAAPEPVDGHPTCAGGETISWCTYPGLEYRILVTGEGDPGCGPIDVELLSDGAPCTDPACINDDCDGDVSQPRVPPDGPWFAGISDAFTSIFAYESFDWAGGDVNAVRWWGFDAKNIPGLMECTDSMPEMVVEICPDVNGVPDYANPLCTVQGLPDATVAVENYPLSSVGPGGLDGWRWDMSFPTPCALPPGRYWLTVNDADEDICSMWWLTSPIGDGQSWLLDTHPNPAGELEPRSYDLAFCINPDTP